MDEEEKRLLDGYKRLSPRSRYIALAQIIAGVEMEENARRMAEAALKEVPPFRPEHGSSAPVLA
jgi:DNA repair ATPase RecN